MAGAAHVPDVVSDRVDEVNGPAIVLTGKGDDTLYQGDTEPVHPHVVEALRLPLLQVLRSFIDFIYCYTRGDDDDDDDGQVKLGGLTQEH